MELWDGYREDGKPAGIDLVRGEEIPAGLYHIVCDVLVRHRDGDYLLMLRDYNKDIHPGEWESTAGGSALKGEDPLQCVKRELFEETGIRSVQLNKEEAYQDPREGTGLFVTNMSEIYREVYREKQALFFCFVCEVEGDKEAVTLQEGETIDYKWLSEEAFIRFVGDGMMPGQKRRYGGWLREQGYLGQA